MSVVYNIVNYMGFCPTNTPLKMKELLKRSTEQQAIFIADYLYISLVLGKKEPPPDRICETVGWVVEEFLHENCDTLDAITEKLDSIEVQGKTDKQVIENVLTAMFADGKYNWGRVSATYAFGVRYCLRNHYDENGNEQNTASNGVMQFVGEYVGQHLGKWIEKQGGWEVVLSLYPNRKVVMQQLRSAGYLILTVGVGSLLNALS